MAHLPPFASTTDLDTRLPGGLAEADSARAAALLDDVAALIRAEAGGRTWATEVGEEWVLVDDVPDVLLTISCAAVRRAIENPDGVDAERFQDMSVDYANASGDVYLKAGERRLVRQAAGRNGVGTISTTREDPVGSSDLGLVDPVFGNVHVDTDSGAPLPFLQNPSIADSL